MALQMNTIFGEILQEVLTSLLITESNIKRRRIRRRCLETKMVPIRSGFALRCNAQTIQERERRGDKQKSTITTEYQKIEKKGYVCMKNA